MIGKNTPTITFMQKNPCYTQPTWAGQNTGEQFLLFKLRVPDRAHRQTFEQIFSFQPHLHGEDSEFQV